METDEIIRENLHFEGGTNDKWFLQASIQEYLKSGKISGSFYMAIIRVIKQCERASKIKATVTTDGELTEATKAALTELAEQAFKLLVVRDMPIDEPNL